TPGKGRSAEAASYLAVGWDSFLQFAAEMGIRDVLPADDEIREHVAALAGSNTALVEGSNPAAAIIAAARDAIATRRGRIELVGDAVPGPDIARTLGWETWDSNGQPAARHTQTNVALGVLSIDGKH